MCLPFERLGQPCRIAHTILGISAFYHDSAAALVVDGQIVAAVQEERFTRHKHDERFPKRAIEYCRRYRKNQGVLRRESVPQLRCSRYVAVVD